MAAGWVAIANATFSSPNRVSPSPNTKEAHKNSNYLIHTQKLVANMLSTATHTNNSNRKRTLSRLALCGATLLAAAYAPLPTSATRTMLSKATDEVSSLDSTAMPPESLRPDFFEALDVIAAKDPKASVCFHYKQFKVCLNTIHQQVA